METKKLDMDTLAMLYEEYLLKIGKEPRIEYMSSSLSDLYIIMKIEHDGVYDVALVDFQIDAVTMIIYDEYKFIVASDVRMSLSVFSDIINDMSKYNEKIKNLLDKGGSK